MIESILGFLPTVIGGFFGAYQKKKEVEHLIALKKLELKEYEMELTAGLEKINIESEMLEKRTTTEVLKDSYKNDIAMNQNTSKWVNNLRASTRPILTYISIALFSIFALFKDITIDHPVVILTSTLIGWWFGSRIKFKNNT